MDTLMTTLTSIVVALSVFICVGAHQSINDGRIQTVVHQMVGAK